MKKFAIYLFVLTITFLLGFNFYSHSRTGITEAKVLELMQHFHQAQQNRDEEKLKQILADEISWSRYKDERFFTKQQVIENVKNTEWTIESTEATFVSTKVKGNQVKVFFVIEQSGNSTNGSQSEHRGDYTYTFEKQQNEWKLSTIHLEN